MHSDAADRRGARRCDDPDRLVHLSYGDFPAAEYLRHVTSFRGFRVFDIARWIGAGTEMPPDLVQGMWDVLGPDMEAWRAIGVYQAAVPVPDDAPLQDRLLGLSGRDPHPGRADPVGRPRTRRAYRAGPADSSDATCEDGCNVAGRSTDPVIEHSGNTTQMRQTRSTPESTSSRGRVMVS